ncbi:MAG: tyrosine-type recombinase/integrase [Nitrospira sp. SB0672_bin_25]|nr:tyrosine-type recombinase/integrase [Nitrospira sp. SB0672_bin_25]
MLTEKKIATITKAGRYTDEQTLHLFVKAGPRGIKRSWVQRIMVYGIRREIGLGPWPVVTLEEARLAAYENRRTVRQGGDPTIKKQPTTPTLEAAAHQYYREHKPTWKQGRAADQWLDVLERYVLPKCGKVPVDKLTRDHLLLALKPIWLSVPEASRKAKGKTKAILDWCMGHGYVASNVAVQIDGALAKKPKGSNMRAVPFKAMRDVWNAIHHATTTKAARLCTLFLILTATRAQEARLAEWSEIDFDSKTWTLPAQRTKMGKAFRVPLSDAALWILKAAQVLGDSRWVFPSPLGGELGDATLRKVMVDAGIHKLGSLHGFRSTFRTWGQETKASDHETLEMCLAHETGNGVAKRYARGDLLDRRQPVMQKWGEYVTGGRPRILPD